MKSTMKHKFSDLPRVNMPRSTFNRSHGVKTTFDSGYLVPFFVDEALPGDTFNLRSHGFARMATPLFPTMDNMFMETFYFSVPLRIIWNNFKKFMGEQDNPSDSTDFVTPKMTSPVGGYGEQTLFDYFGMPTKIGNLQHVAYFTRAYNLIYNEWFRDQNLQDSVTVDKDDGPDDPDDYVLLRRGKRHDYFTSCLPWPQKGTAVDLPIGSTAPITGNITIGNPTVTHNLVQGSNVDGGTRNEVETVWPAGPSITATNPAIANTLEADLSSATAATINQWRQALQIQAMYETDARSGTRYTEVVLAHFGVTSPDARQQRPEYLGGGSTVINLHPVASTNAGSGSSATQIGQVGAFGTASFSGHGFRKSFTEHCIVIGLVNVRADITYQQGLNRMFSRDDRLDFYWPKLSVIGEQAVLNKEIFADASAEDDAVFGYQERYAEYRYKPSTIHGRFRSNATSPLDVWHLSQDYATRPALGPEFIQDDPPIARTLRVTTEPQFIADFYHDFICARPMPLYGIPQSLSRF